jgi:hypothetical protein
MLEKMLLENEVPTSSSSSSSSSASAANRSPSLLTPKYLLKKTYDDQLQHFSVTNLSFPATRDSYHRFMTQV